jgi:small subunit ribosomal protein S21
MSFNRKKIKKSNYGARGGETVAAVPDKFAHIEAVQAEPLEVMVYGNNFEKALRAFRALVQKERVLSTYKERQSYEKPSDKRRRKRNEAVRKQIESCSKGECVHSEHVKNRKPYDAKRSRSGNKSRHNRTS